MCGGNSKTDDSSGLRVYILKRFEEGGEDWSKGMDFVVAHSEEEAKEIAAAHHPVKQDEYKEVESIDLDVPRFVYGCFYERKIIHSALCLVSLANILQFVPDLLTQITPF